MKHFGECRQQIPPRFGCAKDFRMTGDLLGRPSRRQMNRSPAGSHRCAPTSWPRPTGILSAPFPNWFPLRRGEAELPSARRRDVAKTHLESRLEQGANLHKSAFTCVPYLSYCARMPINDIRAYSADLLFFELRCNEIILMLFSSPSKPSASLHGKTTPKFKF